MNMHKMVIPTALLALSLSIPVVARAAEWFLWMGTGGGVLGRQTDWHPKEEYPSKDDCLTHAKANVTKLLASAQAHNTPVVPETPQGLRVTYRLPHHGSTHFVRYTCLPAGIKP